MKERERSVGEGKGALMAEPGSNRPLSEKRGRN